MPRGNGTGPMGNGPMTGRGAGYCAGYPAAGFMNRGCGCGGNFGGGRGWRNMYRQTGQPGWMRSASGPTAVSTPPYRAEAGQEKEYWQGQKKILEKQMQQVEQKLADLSGESQKD